MCGQMKKFTMQQIGIIHSPYKTPKDMPIQGRFKPDVQACIEMEEEFAPGLKDLDQFSHAFVLYYFHKSGKQSLLAQPFLEKQKHGIFAIRSPHRPNHIGLSIIKIEKIQQNKIYFTQVDMLDNTPVLDIKPYVKHFDSRPDALSGWVDKHFQNGTLPDNAILK
jgi:tRNA-Thr(GGU) m(6)t(6)A37 methyltransferase TsaA